MSETKHTPGPWRKGKMTRTYQIPIYSEDRPTQKLICSVDADKDVNIGHANADLIASALALLRQRDILLDACRAVMTELTLLKGLAQTRGKMETAAVQGRIDQVKAAIAACQNESK